MPSSNSEESKIYENLVYPGTAVLKNKAGIKDQKKLEKFEAQAVKLATKRGFSDKAKPLTISGLKQAHKEMFSPVYESAGTFRSYTTGRGEAPFAKPEFIQPQLKKVFDKMNSEIKPNMKKADFVKSSAEFIGELNSVHPFVEGNGRTQRFMLAGMAAKAGFQVKDKSLNQKSWYKAAEESHYQATYKGFEKIIGDSVEKVQSKSNNLKVLSTVLSLSRDSSAKNKYAESLKLSKAGVSNDEYKKAVKNILTSASPVRKLKDKSNDFER